MKIALKILALVFVIAFTMLSCEKGQPGYHDQGFDPSNPSIKADQLQENIRPTKPLKIPDTLAVTNIAPIKPTLPQDSTINKE